MPRKLQREVNEVIELLEQAAAQEHAPSQYELGITYRDGAGVPPNWRMAMKWFEQAASQGDADAQFSLGLMHHQGTDGAPVNFTEAREWYERQRLKGFTSRSL